jgi:hypothetical protein
MAQPVPRLLQAVDQREVPEAMCLGTMSPESLKAVSIQPGRWKASGGGDIL